MIEKAIEWRNRIRKMKTHKKDIGDILHIEIHLDILDYLIEQAERVKELNKELDKAFKVAINLQGEVNDLETENQRYREAIENIKWKVNKELEGLGITEDEQELQKVAWLSELMTICIETLESDNE